MRNAEDSKTAMDRDTSAAAVEGAGSLDPEATWAGLENQPAQDGSLQVTMRDGSANSQ